MPLYSIAYGASAGEGQRWGGISQMSLTWRIKHRLLSGGWAIIIYISSILTRIVFVFVFALTLKKLLRDLFLEHFVRCCNSSRKSVAPDRRLLCLRISSRNSCTHHRESNPTPLGVRNPHHAKSIRSHQWDPGLNPLRKKRDRPKYSVQSAVCQPVRL